MTTHAQHSDDVRAEVGYLFHRNFKRVNNALCWLKLISVISPLLGLLGTVWGMVAVFQAMEDFSHANATVLAFGHLVGAHHDDHWGFASRFRPSWPTTT